MGGQYGAQAPVPATPAGYPATCYRHLDRPAGVRCQHCGRPICGACMTEAPVGHQCPECVARGRAATRQGTLRHGGRASSNPRITSGILIAINALVWVAVTLTNANRGILLDLLALSPQGTCLLVDGRYSGYTSATCAAAAGTWLPGVAEGGWWEIVTSMFTHTDLMHIGFNMVALWFLGPPLERALGRARFLAIYLVSGLAGSALVVWLAQPYSQTIGASGAIFGLLGALLILVLHHKGDVRNLLLWLGLNVAITVLNIQTISWQGHLGGFLGGVAVTYLLVSIRGRDRERRQWFAIGAVVLALLASVLVYGLLN